MEFFFFGLTCNYHSIAFHITEAAIYIISNKCDKMCT
jgi:hypothetical protein